MGADNRAGSDRKENDDLREKIKEVGSQEKDLEVNLEQLKLEDGGKEETNKGENGSDQRQEAPTEEAPTEEVHLSFSPLDNYTSVMKFEDMGLRKEILLGIYDVGFQRPSRIQEKALPLLLSKKPQNLIGQSQSGTGKTAAFTIAALSRVEEDKCVTQVICVSPTRELARQTMSFMKNISKYTKVTLGLAVKDIERGVNLVGKHIIVGTPGTLMGMTLRKRINVSALKVFIVDEADHVLGEPNMIDQTLRIRRYAPRDCQIIFLSATYPRRLISYATRLAPDAHKISLKEEELSVEGITQLYMVCKDYQHKYDVLSAIYGFLTIGQSMVFCQKKVTADQVSARLKADGHTCDVIHSGFTSDERDTTIDKFRNGDTKVLICSNVISRGLDIEQVNVVVNFDIPLDAAGRPDPETYLHSIGRTGRFGRSGVSILLVHDDVSIMDMEVIMKHFNKRITRVNAKSLPSIETELRKVLGLEI